MDGQEESKQISDSEQLQKTPKYVPEETPKDEPVRTQLVSEIAETRAFAQNKLQEVTLKGGDKK